jgi:hypothetical protein
MENHAFKLVAGVALVCIEHSVYSSYGYRVGEQQQQASAALAVRADTQHVDRILGYSFSVHFRDSSG